MTMIPSLSSFVLVCSKVSLGVWLSAAAATPTFADSEGLQQERILMSGEVFYPSSASQIVELVNMANSGNKTVSVGGGRNTKWWNAGDIAISMQNMTKVLYVNSSDMIITVQTGSTAGRIQAVAEEYGMMAAIGQAPWVGVGFLLMGGFGHQTRLMGVASDRILGAELVTAGGEHVCVGMQPMSDPESPACLRLGAEMDRDLLWSIRGAGSNFAVVVSLTLSLLPYHAVTTSFQNYLLTDPATSSRELLHTYSDRARNSPRTLDCDGTIFYDQQQRSWALGVNDFQLVPMGEKNKSIPRFKPASDLKPYWIREERDIAPSNISSIEPSINVQPNGLNPHFTFATPGYYGIGLYISTAEALDGVWPVLLSEIFQCPNTFCYILLQHAGGAVADKDVESTAFAARAVEWQWAVFGVYDASSADSELEVKSWVRRLVRRILPNSLGTYVTDMSPRDYEFFDYASGGFGQNLRKLCRLKNQQDPKGIFSAGSFPLQHRCREVDRWEADTFVT